jgi:hypothetical protein
MTVIVRSETWDVDRRLRDFDLTRDVLIEIVKACVAARGDCTDNDPPAAPGWMSWSRGTRRARELLRPREWEKDDTNSFSTVVNHRRRIRVAVSNTDDGTGVLYALPRNNSRKGTASERAIGQNGTLPLFPDLPVSMAPPKPQTLQAVPTGEYATWYLCVYAEDDAVRAELSLPIDIEGGFLKDFRERIIFLGPDDWGQVDLTGPDDDLGPDFEINVVRK